MSEVASQLYATPTQRHHFLPTRRYASPALSMDMCLSVTSRSSIRTAMQIELVLHRVLLAYRPNRSLYYGVISPTIALVPTLGAIRSAVLIYNTPENQHTTDD